MTSVLAERQLSVIAWHLLRAGGGDAAPVASDLRMLLFAGADEDDGAYERLENEVESQGHLFECAPAVVSVIVAALAEGAIPPGNLAPSLDVLGRILAGYPDLAEVEQGSGDLREKCHGEAMRGFWSLMRAASERDPYNAWRTAVAVLSVLDEPRSRALLDFDGHGTGDRGKGEV